MVNGIIYHKIHREFFSLITWDDSDFELQGGFVGETKLALLCQGSTSTFTAISGELSFMYHKQ